MDVLLLEKRFYAEFIRSSAGSTQPFELRLRSANPPTVPFDVIKVTETSVVPRRDDAGILRQEGGPAS